ncbi:MAG: TonB family protein [Gammaproteobacteria bacterium]|nr:TonB family protein [Gammaproteobacteria bacterium]
MSELRYYIVPFVLALALHAAAMMALYTGWNPDRMESRLIKPQMVHAQLIVLTPRKARPKPVAPSTVVKEPEVEAEPVPAEPEPVVVEKQPDLEAIRREKERAEREKILDRLARTSFWDTLKDEADNLAASDAADEEAIIAQSYRFGVYKLVVANWSRPPSARNNMEAKMLVELVPTGDVVAVTLLASSGNDAFDRSAEAAVRKARRFEVPMESKLFERYFRRFTLLFRPEDLLR